MDSRLDARIGAIARIGILVAMKMVWREDRVRASATAPLGPAVARRKNPAHVGHTVNNPTTAPTPPIHLDPAITGRFAYAYVATAALRPTRKDIVNRRIRFSGMIRIANCWVT